MTCKEVSVGRTINMQGTFFTSVFLLGIANCFRVTNESGALSKLKQFKTQERNYDSEGCHIHVTLHVYSGRPDPAWLIPCSHPSYKVIMRKIGVIPTEPLPCKLGYKGFSLVHIPAGGNMAAGGNINKTVASHPDLELYLLQTSDYVTDELRLHAKHTILETMVRRKRRSLLHPHYDSLYYAHSTSDPIIDIRKYDMLKLAKILGLDKRFKNTTTAPSLLGPTMFEPEKWNKYFIEKHNNCYNYANNRITGTFAQPGRAGNCKLSLHMSNGTEVERSAKCDGLEDVLAPDMNKLPEHRWNLVALVFWPPKRGSDKFDFHWYRLDGNGLWSHKPGKSSVTNLDQGSKPIYDPRYADRGPYTEFVGFLQTRQDKIILI